MNKVIKRDNYLNMLIDKINNKKIKIITGIRRVGKSFLLFNLFYSYLLANKVEADQIITIKLDRVENEELWDRQKLYKYIKDRIVNDKQYFLLIDEIQNVKKFELVLNSFQDQDNIDIYVTGSNSKFLSKDIATTFAGRGMEINVLPLSFQEYLNFSNLDVNQAWNLYSLYGGMPEVVLVDKENEKKQILKDLLTNVYVNDIAERHKLNSTQDVLNIVEYLASIVSSQCNSSRIANSFNSLNNKKTSTYQIDKILDALEDSFLIDKIRKYDIKGLKLLSGQYKYYFVDNGLRNVALNFRNLGQGQLIENAFFNALKINYFDISYGAINQKNNINNQWINNQYEIDFITQNFNTKVYFQVTTSLNNQEVKERELRPFFLTNNNFRKVIVDYSEKNNWIDQDGITHVSLLSYLENPDIIKEF